MTCDKGINYICTKHHVAFDSSDGVEYVRAGVVEAVGVCVVENPDMTAACGPIACTTRLFAAIDFLNRVRPCYLLFGKRRVL